jgi:O-antigen ligase
MPSLALRDMLVGQSFSRLEIVAFLTALLLSLACMLRGAVDASVLAMLAVLFLLLSVIALWNTRPMHPGACRAAALLLLAFAAALSLQALLVPLQDVGAWIDGIARLALYAIVFLLALAIGTSESASRLFMLSLLLSGVACVSLTFFVVNQQGSSASAYTFYSHGFVNANHAATYFGLLLLLTLKQTTRAFRRPGRSSLRGLLQQLDNISMMTLIKASTIVFCLLISVSALLMTASRAGITLALLCGVVFCFCITLKLDLHSQMRRLLVVGAACIAIPVMLWVFSNFGDAITQKFLHSGGASNDRGTIMTATLPMITDHPLLGVGLNNFASTFQRYRPLSISSDGIIDKAHNSYLEFAAEMGLPLTALLLVLLGAGARALYRGIRHRKERYVTPTLGVCVMMLAGLHSVIDFPLQVPALAMMCLAILGISISQSDPNYSDHSQSGSASLHRIRRRKRRRSKSATS